MTRSSLGKHIHSQIIVPLAVTALVVTVSATFVVLRVIEGMTEQWSDQSASSAAFLIESRMERRAAVTQGSLELIATDPRLIDAVSRNDWSALREILNLANRALGTDALMVLDNAGRVVISAGGLPMDPGDQPLGGRRAAGMHPARSGLLLARTGGVHAVSTLVPMSGPGGSAWSLAAATALDDDYVADLAVGVRAGIMVFDDSGMPIAASASEEMGDVDLLADVAGGDVAAAIDAETRDDGDAHGVDASIGDLPLRLVARGMGFENAPEATSLYLVTAVDAGIARPAVTATTNLVILWFVLATIALVTLNWYISRRVSRPLAALSECASRVAGGDYDATVEVPGENEIAGLAGNFNQMTESLRDRSGSVTRKVLELTTLYEMSRSLGSTLELETLLESVLDSAMEIFDVEIGYVTMLDRDTGALKVRAWRGVDLSHADPVVMRRSISDWVVREGRPLIFNPPVEDGASETPAGDSVSGALAALCVPLLSNEGTIGSITVGTRNPEQRFTSDAVRLLATIANHVTIAVGNIGLFSSVQEAYLATVRALAAAVDAKDPYTRGHSDGVAAYALTIGEAMDLSTEQMVALEMAAYLHDIGKIGISEDILLKPGKLTEAEMSQMRHHPLIGANILKPVAFPWPIAPIVRHHHEHFDGDGYPAGLRGDEIPILARVLTVADAFEAMVADRPYRRGRSQEEAILELRRCAGTHFDPRIVSAFIGALEASEGGPLVAGPGDDEIGPEEVQAVLVAVCNGMFASFRRLGGPRLANNLERSANDEFERLGVPVSLCAGQISVDGDEAMTDAEIAEQLTGAIDVISECIERASGTGLAGHFLAEALGALPERMRASAGRLGFVPAS
jgi:putative nucleotidyltransferase with HDIG domain